MGISDSAVMLLPQKFDDRNCTIRIETVYPYKLLLIFEFATNLYQTIKCLDSKLLVSKHSAFLFMLTQQ